MIVKIQIKKKNDIRTRQIEYLDDIKRRSIMRTVPEGKVQVKRTKGRQRYRWMNNITRRTGFRLNGGL